MEQTRQPDTGSASATASEITVLIERARDGDRQASDELFATLYSELKRLARGQLAGNNAPLHATSLVHEVYFRLAGSNGLKVNDRQHFYALAARIMRQIVINSVRARDTQRRGGNVHIGALDSHALRVVAADDLDENVLELDAALDKLAALEPMLAQVVEMRFYGGLELSEISVLLERSERSLKRDWRRARAFLYHEIADTPDADSTAQTP